MRFDIHLTEACSIFLLPWYRFLHKSCTGESFSALKIYSIYRQKLTHKPSICLLHLFFSELRGLEVHYPSFITAFLCTALLLLALSSSVFGPRIKPTSIFQGRFSSPAAPPECPPGTPSAWAPRKHTSPPSQVNPPSLSEGSRNMWVSQSAPWIEMPKLHFKFH